MMIEDRAARISLAICAIVAVHAAAYVLRTLLAPVAFAIFVVAVVWPLQKWFTRRMPQGLALVATLAMTVAVVGVLVFLVTWASGLVATWLLQNAGRFQALYMQAIDWFEGHGIAAKSIVETNFGSSWISGVVRGIGGHGYSLVTFLVIVFAFVVLGLLEVEILRRNVERLENASLRQAILQPASEICVKYQRYMRVRTQMSLLTGAVVWAFALFAGIELATAWGVLAFVLNYIPFLGPLFATVAPTLFALAQFESFSLALAVLACLNAIQFFIGSYLEPRVAGAQLSLSPFLVLFAVFFWSALWGVTGAFIGVPILIAILTICSTNENLRWISDLFGGDGAKAARR